MGLTAPRCSPKEGVLFISESNKFLQHRRSAEFLLPAQTSSVSNALIRIRELGGVQNDVQRALKNRDLSMNRENFFITSTHMEK